MSRYIYGKKKYSHLSNNKKFKKSTFSQHLVNI